jgi:hypothetical protein
MEYIIVTVPGRERDDIDVLINAEKNGKVGETLTLGKSGFVMLSVDLSSAEEKTVDVEGTTPGKPMKITIAVRS